jgi:hypothetical protein
MIRTMRRHVRTCAGFGTPAITGVKARSAVSTSRYAFPLLEVDRQCYGGFDASQFVNERTIGPRTAPRKTNSLTMIVKAIHRVCAFKTSGGASSLYPAIEPSK